MRDPNVGERTFSPDLKELMVRKRGRLVLFIRKIGTIDTHCVFLNEGSGETPILDRVQGVGGVGEDQVQDMEAVSEKEHLRCIELQKKRGEESKAKGEPLMDGQEDLTIEDLDDGVVPREVVEQPAPKESSVDVDSLPKRKLLAIIELEDLDVDTKGTVGEVRARIKAARAGLPDPTKQPVLAGTE